MRWLRSFSTRSQAGWAAPVLQKCLTQIDRGEIQVEIERGATVPGIPAPALYRAVLRSNDEQVGQVMFTWHPTKSSQPPAEPDVESVQRMLWELHDTAVSLSIGSGLGGSVRFTRWPNQPPGRRVLEIDNESMPPRILQAQLIAAYRDTT